MAILAIYSANFNATTRLTTEIFAFEKGIIVVTQDYARTVHLRAVTAICIVIHIDTLNHLRYVVRR
jgi:hypothetical protein